jgi:hypothetical protein
MSHLPEEERFVSNIRALADAVSYSSNLIYRAEPELAREHGVVTPEVSNFLKTLADKIESTVQLEYFITYTSDYWEQIRRKDKEFFLKNARNIEIPLPIQTIKLSMFFDLITLTNRAGQQVLQREIEEEIWTLFHNMVKISIKYINRRRRGGQNDYEAEVDLKGAASRWNVKL